MKDLSNLSPAPGSNRNRKRLGRGIGSGLGKTAGKGHKGQLARTGGVVRPGFEGGQTPIYRRIPKFGFSNVENRIEYNLISLSDLEVFSEGDVVTVDALVKKSMVRNLNKGVKVLNNGELKKKLTIRVHKVSKGAKAAIEKSGGKVEEI